MRISRPGRTWIEVEPRDGAPGVIIRQGTSWLVVHPDEQDDLFSAIRLCGEFQSSVKATA